MPASLPVQRTLAALRNKGWDADVAEKWIPFKKNAGSAFGPPGIRRDLHSFIDVDAFHPDKGNLRVQCCSDGSSKSGGGGDVAAHWNRMTDDLLLAAKIRRCLLAGNRVEIHAWGQRGARGKPKAWCRRRIVFKPTFDHRGIVGCEVEGEP